MTTPQFPASGLQPEDDHAPVDPRLVRAMEDYLEQLEAGQPIDQRSFLEKYPEVQADLERCLVGLEFLRETAPHLTDGTMDLGSAPASTPLPNQLGDFQLIREIGRGGMGIVFEAHQLSLERRVALKILPFASLLDSAQLKRFRNEARAAAMLKHPNIVSVYSVGCERGVHYYAMEFIEGASLAGMIQDRDPSTKAMAFERRAVDPGPQVDTTPIAALETNKPSSRLAFYRRVAQIGIQAAMALDHAHREGVIHRDIKPANLLLDRDGNLHVTDFGLARIQSAEDLTVTGDLLGTLKYISPEQLEKAAVVDQRTDVYSLGATLYELATGTPAFSGETRQEVIQAITHSEPVAPRRIRADLPQDLQTIIQKAMQKDVAERYPTAGSLADDLRRFLDDRPIQARPSSSWDRTRRFAKRNPLVTGLISSIVFLLILLTLASSFVAWKTIRYSRTQQQQARRQELGLYARDLRLAKLAADESRMADLQQLLLKWHPDSVPSGNDHRGFEWYHLWQFLEDPALEQTIDFELPCYDVTFLDTNDRIAVANYDYRISTWQIGATAPSSPLQVLPGKTAQVRKLLVADHGNVLISADLNGNLLVWDWRTGRLLEHAQLDGPGSHDCRTLDLSQDGSRILIGFGDGISGAVRIWNRHDQDWEYPIRDSSWIGIRAAFGPQDEIILAQVDDATFQIRSPETWEVALTGQVDGDGVTALAMDQEKQFLALGVRGRRAARSAASIELWETRSWTRVAVAHLDHSDLMAIAFSPDGTKLVAGDSVGGLYLLELGQDSQKLTSLLQRRVHYGQVRGVSFSADAAWLATCGTDGEARVWSTKDLSQPPTGMKTFAVGSSAMRSFVQGAGFVDGDTAVTSDYSGTCYVWNRQTGERIRSFQIDRQNDNVFQLAAAYGHGLVAMTAGHWPPTSDASGRVEIRDLRGKRKPSSFVVGKIFSSVSDFSPSARYFAVCCNQEVVIIDVEQDRIAGSVTFPHLDRLVKNVRFSPDERWLVCGRNDGIVSIVAVPGFSVSHEFRADRQNADCVDVSPDSLRVAVVGSDRRINIHELRSGKRILQSTESPGFMFTVRYSPDGERLFTGGLDGKVRVWMCETGEELLSFDIPFEAWPTGEFSPDGNALIVSTAREARVFETASRHSLQRLSLQRLLSEACGNLISSSID